MTETEKKLLDALRLASFALNEIPNNRVRHERYRNSYEIAAEIDKVLKDFPDPVGGSNPPEKHR